MAITTPPFRTSLLTQNGAPFGTGNGDIQTTRDWWLYWQQLTDRTNANSKLATAGTHADRPMPESMPEGALYYENDRGVLYASTLGVWQYVAGTMWGTLSPDQRPTDLGTHDAGFDFRTNVAPAREFIWSQTAWVEVASQTGDVQAANSTTNLGFTTSPQQVPGTVIVLNRAGRYLITGNYTLYLNDFPNVTHGDLFANGASYGSGIELQAANGTYAGASQQWLYTAGSAGQSVYLRGWKDGGTGNSATLAPFTSITALWISA